MTALAKKHPDKNWATWTLEELRMARECAIKNGNMARALVLATQIDRKRGFYV